MKFLSKVKLSNRRYKTPEGYLVCVDSIIARTGKQEYLKSEIFQDSNDDSVIQIDRPKSEVLSPSTIASFENKPLVDEHPDEDVNVDNYRDYAIGFARDVRASKLNDVDILIANLIFTDPEAIAEIESGEKTELSCGYDCDILGEGDNLYQANIRGNHIALCKAGRAGIARIQDTKIKDSKWFIVYGEESGYMKEFKTLPEAKRFIKETQKFDKREGIEDKYYIEVEVHDSVKDSKYSKLLKDLSPEERSKKIDELIADEEEAIVGYKEAMKYANEADKSIYAHIIAEELEHITELKTLRAENFEESKDSNIKDIDFKYLTEEAKKLKEELNLYKRQIGSHKSTNEREYSPRQNQKNNEYVKELNESINQAIKFLSEGNYNKQAWIRLALNLESWKGEPELENICKKAENAIKKFTKYINEKNNMLNVDSYEKVTKDEENKKMRDGALRGIHLKKIRNTLRNEDEDLVEDFLDYMDTRPDLVKEYDDYSDYMVREDFETWKKYKKIKARDVDTYEEVTEDLEKELKDSDTLKNLAYKFAQMGNYFDRAHSANSRKILGKEDDEKLAEFYNLGLQVYKQLEQEVDYLKNNKITNSNRDYGFLSETASLLEDGSNTLYWTEDKKCKLLSKKIDNLLYEYKKHTYRDSKVKDSKKLLNIIKLYKKATKDSKVKDRDFIIEKVIKSAKDSKGQKFYIVLGKFSDKNEKSYLVTSENPNNKYFVGAGTVEKSLNEAEKTLQMYTKDSIKDTHFTVSSNRNSEEFNSEEELLKKYKIEGYDTVRGIKAPKLKGLMGPFFNGNGKILYETKERYGSYDSCKDSKVKDSMTKVNIETSLSIFDLQKAARKFDVIVILSNYTDHVYAILKGEKEDIVDLLSYLDNKGVLMKYPKGF